MSGRMSAAGARFTRWVLRALDERLKSDPGALATLASGAAFEAWLAFETRILVERGTLLAKAHPGWFARNENGKCDLSVHSYKEERGEELQWLAEYKVVYTNRRWPQAVQGVISDLVPKGQAKKRLAPTLGRVAVVALVGKTYRAENGGKYADCGVPRPAWRKAVLNTIEANGARRVFSGERHEVSHEWLEPGSWVELHGYALRA